MSVLVTGATGFLGGALARRLAAGGQRVVAVVRPGSNTDRLRKLAPAVLVREHDGSTGGLLELAREAAPDTVFHLASCFVARHQPGDVEPLVRSNLLFAAQLAEAAAAAGVKGFVNAGTGWQHYRDADYDPVCLYAATKQAFESVLRFYAEARGLRVVTLKLFDTYGPGDERPKLFRALQSAAEKGERLAMSPGGQLLDLVYVDDVVEAFLAARARLLAGEARGMEDYAVSGGRRLTLREVVAAWERATGRKVDVDWGGRPYRDREVMEPWTRGARLPGWAPRVGLDDGLRRMHEADVRG